MLFSTLFHPLSLCRNDDDVEAQEATSSGKLIACTQHPNRPKIQNSGMRGTVPLGPLPHP